MAHRPTPASSSLPELLEHQIAHTRGDIEAQNLLGSLHALTETGL